MELHPEQRFELARQRQAEKLARGLEAYHALRAQEEHAAEDPARSRRLSRQHRFHAVAVVAVVIGIVSALAGTARGASSAPMWGSKVPGRNAPAPAPVSASARYSSTLEQALAELRRLAGLSQPGQAVGGYGSFFAG